MPSLELQTLSFERPTSWGACPSQSEDLTGQSEDLTGSTEDAGDLDVGGLLRAREETQRLLDGLIGRTIPPLLLGSSHGNMMDLQRCASVSAAIYLYPGAVNSPDGGRDSAMVDLAQHRGFAAVEPDMSALELSVVGISTQSQDEQIDSALAHRIRHPLLSDPQLSLADELGLPTFIDGVRRYRRLTIIARGGRIGKVFYPVEGARNPAQIVAWAKVQGL